MFSALIVLICTFSCVSKFGLESSAQELYSFRQFQEYLQIFFSTDELIDGAEYYNIVQNGFEYGEGLVACRNLSNQAMVEYERVDDTDSFPEVEMKCDNLAELIGDCSPSTRSANEVISLTCLASSDYNKDDIRMLEDGTIIQLKELGNGFIWGHFCLQDNTNWDMDVADLACESLGYEGVKDGPEDFKWQIDKRGVYGLIDINCAGASNFSGCTNSPRSGNGRCGGEDVIAITCENFTRTSMQPSLSSTMSTMGTAISSNINVPVTFQSPIPSSSNVAAIVQQTNIPIPLSSTTAPPAERTPTMTSQVMPTTPNTLNRAEENLAKIIAIVATALVVIIILLIIGFVIVMCVIVTKRRKKNIMDQNTTHYDEGDDNHYESTRYLNASGEHMYNAPGELLANSISNPVQNGNVFTMNPIGGSEELYYEMSRDEAQEDIYSSMIYECDQVVPNTTSRKYYSTNDTTEQTNESLYLQPNTVLPCFIYQNDAVFWEPEDSENGIYAQMSEKRYREVDPSLLTKDKVLGQGNFGIVHSGVWNSRNGEIPVAIKSLKVENKETNLSFLQEAAILGQFNHPNVLKLLGVVTLSKPYMMVTELLISGMKDQLNKVRKSGKTNIIPLGSVLARFTTDIALGMQYLASKKFVHRDLAARNILVNQTLSCKIGDFGLARMAEDNDYYMSSGGLIPLRWTAPEAVFYKKYSEKSDVWSYGITLYEIWSVGRAPWENFTTDEIIENISESTLLSPPTGCPMFLYELMVSCWNSDKDLRPSFEEIVRTISSNEHRILKRGNQPAEKLDLGLDPMLSRTLFFGLQNSYK